MSIRRWMAHARRVHSGLAARARALLATVPHGVRFVKSRFAVVNADARLSAVIRITSLASLLAALAVALPESRWEEWRFTPEGLLSDEVVLVGLDGGYTERYGPDEPVSRRHLAALIDTLSTLGPSVLAIDVHVGNPSAVPEEATLLYSAIERAARRGVRIVVPIRLGGYGANRVSGRGLRVLTPPVLDTLAIQGYIDYEAERDRRPLQALFAPPAVRSFPVAAGVPRGPVVLSFPVAAVLAHRGLLAAGDTLDREKAGTLLRSLGAPIEAIALGDGEHTAPLHYEALATPGAGGLSYFPSDDPPTTRKAIEGRLVLVAVVFPSADGLDTAQTPFGPARGGLVHAYALDTMLREVYPRALPDWTTIPLAAALVVLSVIGWLHSSAAGVGGAAAAITVYITAGFWLYAEAHLLIPMAWPVWSAVVGTAASAIFFRPGSAPR